MSIAYLVVNSTRQRPSFSNWNNEGVADNYEPKALVAFGLPVLFLVINIYSKLRLFNEPSRMNHDHAQSVQLISTWLIPPVFL